MLKETQFQYTDGDVTFDSFYVVETSDNAKKPGILVIHDWMGISDFTRDKARALAELGYAGVAVDLYGEGKTATNHEEAAQLMTPLANDRALLLKRIQLAYKEMKKLPQVASHQTAAMGFCFGGMTALDLARSGESLTGVVSFHGRLIPPNLPTHTIQAKVLVLHGFDDPMAPPDDVIAFAKEMNIAKANWEIDMYGHAMHSFTRKTANDKAHGMAYDAQADKRAWDAMQRFFAEIF